MDNSFDLRRIAPTATRNIIFINLLLWLAQLALPRLGIDLTERLGMHYWQAEGFAPYQLLSYMFLHSPSGLQHVFFNMFSVWMFGSTVERYWGARRFVIFYFLTGLTAALLQQAVWSYELSGLVAQYEQVNLGHTIIPMSQWLDMHLTIGASGAVFGILLAFGMLFPNTELFLFLIPFPIKAKYYVIGYGLIELFLGVKPGLGDSVAHFAHLGGMLGGFILIMLWRKKGVIDGPYN